MGDTSRCFLFDQFLARQKSCGLGMMELLPSFLRKSAYLLVRQCSLLQSTAIPAIIIINIIMSSDAVLGHYSETSL